MHLYLPWYTGHFCVRHRHKDDVVNSKQGHEDQCGFQQFSVGKATVSKLTNKQTIFIQLVFRG